MRAGAEPLGVHVGPLPLTVKVRAVTSMLVCGKLRMDMADFQKGLTITRFNGLGEMVPEELWDTTLDPVRRTMLKVRMNDAIQAERMFRMLMGTEVEGRRDFILKHRANVEDIDYGS